MSTVAKERLWPEMDDEECDIPTDVHYFGLRVLTSNVVFRLISYTLRLPPDNLFFVQPENTADAWEDPRWEGVYGDILVLMTTSYTRVVNFPREVFVLLEEHLRNFFVTGRQRRPMLTLSKKGKLKVEFLIRDGEGRYRGKDGWAV